MVIIVQSFNTKWFQKLCISIAHVKRTKFPWYKRHFRKIMKVSTLSRTLSVLSWRKSEKLNLSARCTLPSRSSSYAFDPPWINWATYLLSATRAYNVHVIYTKLSNPEMTSYMLDSVLRRQMNKRAKYCAREKTGGWLKSV